MAYLQRFYLHQSLLENDPQQLVNACLFLSVKVHEMDLPHTEFCKRFGIEIDRKKTPLAVNEQALLRGLNFQL